MSKRYEASYINPNFCDGFWDNEETRYLNDDEIKNKLYENLDNKEIEEILNRKGNKKSDEKDVKSINLMGNVSLILEGLGIAVIGVFTILWFIIVLISCVMMAGLISVKLGFSGYYWWFSSIVVFSLLWRILFYGKQTSSDYGELVDKYKDKCEDE